MYSNSTDDSGIDQIRRLLASFRLNIAVWVKYKYKVLLSDERIFLEYWTHKYLEISQNIKKLAN